MDRLLFRLFGTIALLCLTPNRAFSYNTVFNPFTGKLDYVGLASGATVTISSMTVSGQLTAGTLRINEDSGLIGFTGYALDFCSNQIFNMTAGTAFALGDPTGTCGTASSIVIKDDPNFSTTMIPSNTTMTDGTNSLSIGFANITGPAVTARFKGIQITSNTVTGGTTFYQNGQMNMSGSGVPANSFALCFLGGQLGHCTTVVGVGGGCTCAAP